MRSARHGLGLVLLTSILVAGCGTDSIPSADPTPAPSGAAAPSAEATPTSSTGAGPTASPSAEPATEQPSAAPSLSQTQTDFGTIWDGVPAGFPRFTGGRDADDAGPGPASDVYLIEGGDAPVIAEWLQSAMEAATYSTEGLSGPFEDGGFELVSVGEGDCRIRTTVTPQGDQVLVAVLYGAACPAS